MCPSCGNYYNSTSIITMVFYYTAHKREKSNAVFLDQPQQKMNKTEPNKPKQTQTKQKDSTERTNGSERKRAEL